MVNNEENNMRRIMLFLIFQCLGMAVPVMAQTDVEVTDSVSEDWGGGQSGNLDPDYPAVKITAKSYTRVYGDDNPAFEYTSEGATLMGTPEIVCEATATSPVGKYQIIIQKGSVTNHNDTYVNGVLTITKAPLTVKVGTYAKMEGEDNPEFTLTYDGFKNNETEAVLTKKPTATTTATKDSPAGNYDILVSGGEAQNYELSYENGMLTVTVSDGVATISVTHPVDIYTLLGYIVRKNTATLEGLPKGVYIVNGRKIVIK